MPESKPPTRREVRIALGLAASLLFALVLYTALSDGGRHSDLIGYYTGGLILRQGNPSKLYDLGEQAQIQWQLFHRKELLIDNHPPFEALWFAALARLDYIKAYVLWGAINVLLWLFFQHILRPHALTPRNPYHYFWLCSLFVPLWLTLTLGQTSILLLLLFSLTFIYLKRGQDFKAGIFLGLGLFKFPIVLPFALVCLLRRKWRMVAGFAAAAVLLGGLSLVAVGTKGVQAYANLLIDIMRNPDNPAYVTMKTWSKMPTVKGVCATLLSGRIANISITWLAAGISAPLIFFAAWRWRQEERTQSGNSLHLMFAATLVVSQVTALHLYAYDLSLFLLAVLLVIGSPQWSLESSQRTILSAIIVIFYFPPVYYALLVRWQALYLLALPLVAFALVAISLARKVEIPIA